MKDRTVLIVGCATLFCGYVCGGVALRLGGIPENVSALFSLSPSVLSAFFTEAFPVAAVLLCGLCVFGWLLVCPLLFIRFFGLGYFAGLLLAVNGVKGLLPLGLCLFPSAAVEGILLVCSAREATSFSVALAGSMCGRPITPSAPENYAFHALSLFQTSALCMLWDLCPAPLIAAFLQK